ncbi:MAG: DNA gyrase inhibitor YacG [Phycisphaerales bacterium]|nr:DNA gyrase inhibitor YacG [Phycisphaerales bacterium]
MPSFSHSPPPPPDKPFGNDGTVFRCPMCKTLLPNINVPTFPFCSDRCRLLDLNNWMTGQYTTSRPIDPTDELEDSCRGVPEPQ